MVIKKVLFFFEIYQNKIYLGGFEVKCKKIFGKLPFISESTIKIQSEGLPGTPQVLSLFQIQLINVALKDLLKSQADVIRGELANTMHRSSKDKYAKRR